MNEIKVKNIQIVKTVELPSVLNKIQKFICSIFNIIPTRKIIPTIRCYLESTPIVFIGDILACSPNDQISFRVLTVGRDPNENKEWFDMVPLYPFDNKIMFVSCLYLLARSVNE